MGRKPRSLLSSPKIRSNEQVDTCQDEVKAWDFFVAPSTYDQYTPKINNDVNVKIVEELTATLTKRQLQLFRSTCFGYFLDMPKQIRHNALLHWLMTRQIKPASGDDLWFDVNGYRLHFGLGEFGLVSGLKCTGAIEESRLSGKNRLMQKYFGGKSSLYRFHLTRCFHSKCWKNNDADALKIALLYFICTFLFATPTRKDIGCLDLKYIDIVENGEYDNYPWGVDVFNITKASLDKKIVHKPSSYRHSGFTLAIQAWLCETCPAIAGVVASRVPSVYDSKVPCLLNWSGDDRQRVSNSQLLEIFANSVEQLNIRNILPTDVDVEELVVGGIAVDITEKDLSATHEQPQNRRVALAASDGAEEDLVADCVQSHNEGGVPEATDVGEEHLVGDGVQNHNEGAVPDASNVAARMQQPVCIEPNSTQRSRKDFTQQSSAASNNSEADLMKLVEHELDSFKTDVKEKFEQYVDVKIVDVVNGITSIIHKHVPDYKVEHELDSFKADVKEKCGRAHAMENHGSCGRDNRDDIMFEQNSPEHVAFVGPTSRNDSPDVHHERFHSSVCATTEVSDGSHTVKRKAELSDAMENEKDAGRTNTDDIKFQHKIPENPTFVDANSPNVTAEVTPVKRGRKRKSQGSAKWTDSRSKITVDSVQCPPSVIECDLGTTDAGAPPKKMKQIVSGRFPFQKSISEDCGNDCLNALIEAMRKPRGHKKADDLLDPAIDFVVAEITTKNWFRVLQTCGALVTSNHLDVIFYYFRKKIKHNLKVKITTTDHHFDNTIQAVYQLMKREAHVETVKGRIEIVKYMLGYRLCCNTPWYDVDEVLSFVYVEKKSHWILLRLLLRSRDIFVYDSLPTRRVTKAINDVVTAYAVLVPLLLDRTAFYSNRNDLVLQNGLHNGKTLTDPYNIVYVEKLPKQRLADCGAYVASFAEHIIEKIAIKQKGYDIHEYRLRYAALLWEYGCQKITNNEDSDSEYPSKCMVAMNEEMYSFIL